MAISVAITPTAPFRRQAPGELEPGNALATWGSRTSRSSPMLMPLSETPEDCNRQAAAAHVDEITSRVQRFRSLGRKCAPSPIGDEPMATHRYKGGVPPADTLGDRSRTSS